MAFAEAPAPSREDLAHYREAIEAQAAAFLFLFFFGGEEEGRGDDGFSSWAVVRHFAALSFFVCVCYVFMCVNVCVCVVGVCLCWVCA
jgi:hypothetical protein